MTRGPVFFSFSHIFPTRRVCMVAAGEQRIKRIEVAKIKTCCCSHRDDNS